jgi:predicted Zn-dependent peptidase
MAISFKQHTLPNGLAIVAEVDDAAHTAAAGFFVNTGARDEEAGVMGVSHFLEHMMFKGTAKRSAERLNLEFDELGARNNAYTGHEVTAYYAATLPEHLAGAIDVLGDMLRPALRAEDFETERGVILEEIAMYEDEPLFTLDEHCLEAHYGGHGLGHRILGTKETIARLKVDEMRAYFARRYSSDNTTLVLAGKVDFEACCRQVEALCGHWKAGDPGRDAGLPAMGGRQVEARSAKVSQAYSMMIAPGPGSDDPRRYAGYVAAMHLGGPDNSRLHWALIETGLAEDAEAGFDPRDGVGEFKLLVACEPERLEEAWGIATGEVERVGETITEADVARIRAKVATGVTLAGEQPEGRMHRLGRLWTSLRKYNSLEEELQRIEAVTVEDVRSLAREFPWSPATVGRLLPAAE